MSKDKEPTTTGEQSQRVKTQLQHDAEYWRTTLSTYEGRVVVWRILEMCGVFRDFFSTEASASAHFLGQRHVGLKVMADIQLHSAKAYRMMEQEELERQTKAQPNKGESNE